MSALSEHQIINEIRESRKLRKLWDKLKSEDKREFIDSLEGDTWHLQEILEEFVAEKK